MVLRSTAIAALLLLPGCLGRAPMRRLSERTPVAVAFALETERGRELMPAPDALVAQLFLALAERNLEAREVPFPKVQASFTATRDSSHRLEALRSLDKDAPLLLLVEVRASFFSQLEGRYRWSVDAKLSAARNVPSASPVESAFEIPAFLQFDHEREAEAVRAVSAELTARAGTLFDSFLGQMNSGPAAHANMGPIYFVLVDRFANGDASNDAEVDLADPAAFHGGDLAGLIQHLDELKALGVETVWLSPIMRTRGEKFFGHGAFHGYWTYDINAIEPRFGSEAQLRRLSDELHARGMKLLLDLVLNHVGPDAPLVREHPDWFHNKGALVDWSDAVQLTERDVHGLPDFAQEREEVYRHLLDAALGWIRKANPDGFRLDAVKHMPLAFWARFNTELRARAGRPVWLLGEWLDGDPATIARAQAEGKFDAMFDFPTGFALVDVFCRGESPARLGAALSQDRAYSDPGSLVSLADNHDLPRLKSLCREPGALDQALTVALTLRGTPSLTYGTEAALEGEAAPYNRGDMRFDERPLEPLLRQLFMARRAHEALRDGISYILDATDGRLAYVRLSANEAVVVAINAAPSAWLLALPDELKGHGPISDVLTGEPVDAGQLVAPARSVRLFALSASRPAKWRGLVSQKTEEQRQRTKVRRISLEAAGAPLRSGERVYWVGSGSELGQWNPLRAVGPVDGNGGAVALLPVGALVEYKLVIRAPRGVPRWEGGKNRMLLVRDGPGDLKLQLAWKDG